MSFSLVVLAAGMGSRYGGLKQMDPMGPSNETVLDYSVYDAIQAGCNEIIFIIRRDFEEAFRTQITQKFEDRIKVQFAFQELSDLPLGFTIPEGRTKPWGTAHALRAARELITQPFIVINADDFYGRDAYLQVTRFFQTNTQANQYTMVGYPLANTLSNQGGVNRGVCQTDDNQNLEKVTETLDIQRNEQGSLEGNSMGERMILADQQPVSLNFWGFRPEFMAAVEDYFLRFLKTQGTELKSESFLPIVIDELIQQKIATCQVLNTNATWLGVTYPEDKAIVVNAIAKLVHNGIYPKQLW